MDLFASNIGIMLKYFCTFTIIIAMLSMLFVCVLHFVFYVNPNLIRTCDRGENCRRRKQAYKEHVIKRNNATNTIIYDLRKNGIQSNDSLPEPLFLEHLIWPALHFNELDNAVFQEELLKSMVSYVCKLNSSFKCAVIKIAKISYYKINIIF